jgi:hypothetical protein
MRVDWIRNFRLFTLVESFGYLYEKLEFLDKYDDAFSLIKIFQGT